MRSGYPLAARTRIPLDELITCPWILPGAETALRTEPEEFLPGATPGRRGVDGVLRRPPGSATG